jgi:hypothetical protein
MREDKRGRPPTVGDDARAINVLLAEVDIHYLDKIKNIHGVSRGMVVRWIIEDYRNRNPDPEVAFHLIPGHQVDVDQVA